MIRIHTPASERRHRLSATPGIAGMWRNMRCSRTASRCSRSNSSAPAMPHSAKSHERASASVVRVDAAVLGHDRPEAPV